MGLLGFDPQQVGTVLQAGNTVKNDAIFTGARLELVEARSEALGFHQLTVLLDDHVAIIDVGGVFDHIAIQETVVLIAEIAWLIGDGNFLRQASTE